MSYPQHQPSPYPEAPPDPRQPRPWLWVGLVAAVLAVIGGLAAVALSNGSEPSRSERAVAALPAPAATTAVAAASSPVAPPVATSPVAAKPLKVGQTHTFTANDGNKAAVTILKHQAHDDTYGIQVRTCNQGSTVFIASALPWMLSYDGGEELSQESITGGGLLAPAFTQGDLEPGGCRKGWLNFVKSGSPDGAEYRLEGETRARWEW